MGTKHTIETLTTDVDNFKRSVNRRLTTLTNTVVDDVQPKVQEMHEYIIDQKGYERGKANSNKDGSININKDVWALIIKLVLIIAALVGVSKLTS